MADANIDREPVEALASEYVDRQRRGEQPTVEEYVARYPGLADEIRELFPTIASLEQWKTRQEQSAGGRASLGPARLEKLGEFRLLHEIGRGGMGIVYEAEQQSLGRHVALKVLPRQSLLDEKQVQRFRREAQTAAQLHHTNIVPVFGVGHEDGYHFFVMQLIRGVGLDSVLAQLRSLQEKSSSDSADAVHRHDRLAADPREIAAELVGLSSTRRTSGRLPDPDIEDRSSLPTSLSGSQEVAYPAADTEDFKASSPTTVEDRSKRPGETHPQASAAAIEGSAARRYWRHVATIGLQASRALEYAHGQGTLHRDIKPANLLLDEQGVVWMADFGLAKAVQDVSVSRTGDLVGTLRYMAPERFRTAADSRSDIYSLGITLYELLTLQPAYEDEDHSRLIRRIAQEEPLPPRKLNKDIPRGLEAIVMKAAARHPKHRYQSASELADDLARWLDGRSISARRASSIERLWRWSCRNRAIASLTVSAAVLLVAITAVSSIAYLQTKRANTRMQSALDGEQQASQRMQTALDGQSTQREKAEAATDLALEAVDRIFAQFAPSRIAGPADNTLEDSAGEEIDVPLEPVLSKQNAELLEHMLVLYERLAEQDQDDPHLERRVADANGRLGDIHQRLGNVEQSEAAYAKAIDLYRALASQPDDANEYRVEIARMHNEMANVFRQSRSQEKEHSALHKALMELEDAASLDASSAARYELARTHFLLGRGRPRAVDRGTEVRRPPPPREGRPEFGRGPRRRPRHHELKPPRREHRRPGGEPHVDNDQLLKAARLLEQLIDENPREPDYRHLLACCYREMAPSPFGSPTSSGDRSLEMAIKVLEGLAKEFPHVAAYRFDLSEAYAMTRMAGPFDAGDELVQRALEISQSLAAEHPNVPDYAASQVRIHMKISKHQRRAGEMLAAEESLRDAARLQASLAAQFPEVTNYQFSSAVVCESLASLQLERDDLPAARANAEKSIAILESHADSSWRPRHYREMLTRNRALLDRILVKIDESLEGEPDSDSSSPSSP